MRQLRAGGAVGCAAAARHIFGVSLIHHARAGHAFVRQIAIRSAADHLGDLFVRVGGGEMLRHDRAHAGRRLGERIRQQCERVFQAELDCPIVGCADLVACREQRLAKPIARAPASDRGHTVTRQHLAVIVERQSGTQRDPPGLAAIIGHRALCHLRLRPVLAVETEQRVENQKPVVARLIGRGPDRVQYGQIGLRHERQYTGTRAAGDRRRSKAGSGRNKKRAAAHAGSGPVRRARIAPRRRSVQRAPPGTVKRPLRLDRGPAQSDRLWMAHDATTERNVP